MYMIALEKATRLILTRKITMISIRTIILVKPRNQRLLQRDNLNTPAENAPEVISKSDR